MPEDAIAATLSRTGITNYWIHLYENNDVLGGISSQIKNKKLLSFDYYKALDTETGDVTATLYESDSQLGGVTANPTDLHFTGQWTQRASSASTNTPLGVNGWSNLEFITPYTLVEGKFYYVTLTLDNGWPLSARKKGDDLADTPQSAVDHGADPNGNNIWGGMGNNAGYPLHRLHFEVCE